MDRYALTRVEAADMLRVTTRQIDRLITAGTIPSAMVAGRRLIPYAALIRFIDDNTTVRRTA
jgi:excisionase family DNA binding protein